ncbi:hypothetical protein BH09PSE1_BH09PSE1_14940 [soil metagenome]
MVRSSRPGPLAIFGLLLAAWLVFALPTASRAADPTFPTLTGRVFDGANLLSPQAEAALTTRLAGLEADTGDQLVVVTLDSLQGYEIEDYGYRLGRHWGIGQKATDKGVLLIVAPNERKVRIEVGYGLEPVLTDALSSQIIQTDILPPFRTSGGFERGIDAGVDAITAQLRLDPEAAQARAAAVTEGRPELPVGTIILIALVFFFILIIFVRSASGGGRRRRGGVGSIVTWAALDALSRSGGGSRGGGGGFGGGSFGGGGGFSGGGGSFGGGGASGGW